MNKKDIATIVARDSHLSLRESTALVTSVFSAMSEILSEEGERVSISGFGTFTPYTVPARTVKSPIDNKPMKAAKTSKVLFSPSDNLKSDITSKNKAPKRVVKKKK